MNKKRKSLRTTVLTAGDPEVGCLGPRCVRQSLVQPWKRLLGGLCIEVRLQQTTPDCVRMPEGIHVRLCLHVMVYMFDCVYTYTYSKQTNRQNADRNLSIADT